MKALLLVPLCALLATAAVTERTIEVTGRVTDVSSGAPIAGAQVTTMETGHGTLTDRGGTYRLELPAGLRGSSVTVQAHVIGYEAARRTVTLSGADVRVDFPMGPTSAVVDELVVAGEQAKAVRRDRVQLRAAAVMESAAQQAGMPIAPAPPPYRTRHEAWNTESYSAIDENEFLSVRANPLSTFSIDVDRASYTNIRRFLNDGQLPPKDAVRIEEMVNYFPYSDAEPRGEHPLAVSAEVMPAPWQPQHRLVRIGLQAPRIDMQDLPPNNLVFLLDVSGSMTSPDKLPLLKQAMRLLVNELREEDRVAIVVYAGSAGLVLPSTAGNEKETILDAIESLEAGGSTAGGAGIRLAYDVAQRSHLRGGNNRVILATDGDFNVGVSSDAEMIRLIEERRGQGTFLTVLGFGTGNLKDSKMEALADHGNGNYAYIDDVSEARKVLVSEAGGTLLAVAKDVKLQVEFNPAHVRAYRLIGYENRLLAAEDFDDDTKDAGELGAGHTVTALYEVVPVGVEGTVEVRVPGELRYQERSTPARDLSATHDAVGGSGQSPAGASELAWVKLRYKPPTGDVSRLLEVPVNTGSGRGSVDMRFAAAVAEFGMLLRESTHRGSATYGDVITLARGALGADEDGYRAEFVRMVEIARGLSTMTADAH